MRVLVNGRAMLGNITGVGNYGLRLLEGLAEAAPSEGLEELGVFDGRRIVSSGEFLACSSRPARGGLNRLAPWLRGVPGARRCIQALHSRRLTKAGSGSAWTLFHEPNFVSPSTPLPLVTTVHDLSWLRHPEFLPRDRLAWLRSWFQRTLARTRCILTISMFTRRELLELCPDTDPQRVVVSHLGVDVRWYQHPMHAERAEDVRKRLKLPRKYVLFLGTLEPRKNLQGLLGAYEMLPEQVQRQYPLVLAGLAGWRQGYFREAVNRLRRKGVLFETGYVSRIDAPAVMRMAAAFCFPSLYEGFGLPPLEAAACGTPVICSNTAALPEIMGDAAEYVDPHNYGDIARGLLRVLTNEGLANELRELGLARALEFPWKNCATQTLKAYRRAA